MLGGLRQLITAHGRQGRLGCVMCLGAGLVFWITGSLLSPQGLSVWERWSYDRYFTLRPPTLVRDVQILKMDEKSYRDLDHNPGFVHILHVGRDDSAGHFYYVMETADDELSGQEIVPGTYWPKPSKPCISPTSFIGILNRPTSFS